MESRLREQFTPLEQTLRRARLFRKLAVCWGAMAAAGVVLLLVRGWIGWNPGFIWMLPLIGGATAAMMVWSRERRQPADFRALAAAVERDHPELRHLFSAALEQEPSPDSGQFSFLQLRVIDQVLTHSLRNEWEQSLKHNSSFAWNTHAAAFVGFVIVMLVLGYDSSRERSVLGSWIGEEITVSPGDTEVERGTGLVISARFGRNPPPDAALVLVSASGATKRIPLERHFTDPVFGTSLNEITGNGSYHIEYNAKKTRGYRITVFDYPELLRADASLDFPRYTDLTNRIIRDTRRISAVEGTRLTYTLQLNKPVVRARLMGSEQKLILAVQSNAVALLNDFRLTNSARYSLELVDAEGRTNKVPADVSIHVLANRRPDLKLTFPRGDPRVSKLEELQLQAQAADDFGLLKYGIGYGVVGREPQLVEMGQSARANETRPFGYMIPLEKLGVDVDQVISYFTWADDYGPDGQVRRTFSDIFFAEVRPFEEIFRRDQSGTAGNQGGQGNPGAELAQLQKEIVIATWKLQQEKTGAAETRQP
jgi:hypothetical protein